MPTGNGLGLTFFMTNIRSAKEDEVETRPDVGLVFIDSDDKAYLSITRLASVMREADKTKAAWRKIDEVWWPGGPDYPAGGTVRCEVSDDGNNGRGSRGSARSRFPVDREPNRAHDRTKCARVYCRKHLKGDADGCEQEDVENLRAAKYQPRGIGHR
jgi:hypothetical protein